MPTTAGPSALHPAIEHLLQQLESQGLITVKGDQIELTPEGRRRATILDFNHSGLRPPTSKKEVN